MSLTRLPPQDIETEIACLASILLSRDALLKVTELLIPEDFYLEKHRIIYEIVLELEQNNIPIDLTTVKQKLSDKKLFEKIGKDAALVELYQSVSTSANAEFYAMRIKELSLRRKVIEVSTDSIEKCFDTMRPTNEIIDEVEKEIFNVTQTRDTKELLLIDSVLLETLNTIGQWYETKRIITGTATGFKDLDEMLTGFHESELIIIAARPGMGKTALALNIMNNIAIREEMAVLFFSLEMPATQLGMRMLCIESMIDSQRVRTGHISSEELKQLFQTSEKIRKTPIYIDDTPSLDIMKVRAKARRVAQKHPLGAIFVDYLQLISSTSKVDRHLQVAEISRFLKQLARELKVPVIALSQLSRAVEQRADQRPTLADLRESGAIEQDADVVMFIYREEKIKKDTEKKGIADIIVAKQRNGPVGDISLKFWEKYTRFDNLTHVESYDNISTDHEI